MKNTLLLLVTAFVLSTTATFATNTPASTPASTMDAPATGTKADMTEMIRAYMASYNIQVMYISQIQGCNNYTAKDVDGVWYVVYTDGAIIRGHEEIDY